MSTRLLSTALLLTATTLFFGNISDHFPVVADLEPRARRGM